MWQVLGQERLVSLFQRSLERNVFAHAYLFVGPPHVGKMTLALNLAQALNCDGTLPPCGECDSCKKIAAAKHADVQIIGVSSDASLADGKAKTEINVEQIKQMQHSVNLPPFEGKYKVFIIENSEQISIGAANRLLKTLEEPLDKIIFILLTANPGLLPETVISRCQRLELALLAVEEVEKALIQRSVETEKARLLARLCHGCPGWAISAVGDDSLLQQRAERIEKLLEVVSANYEERFSYAAQLVSQFGKNRGTVFEVLDLWLDWWRDLLLVKANCNNAIINVDHVSTLSEMAGVYSLAQLRFAIDAIHAAGRQLRQNANPQLVLEVLLLDIPKCKSKIGSVT